MSETLTAIPIAPELLQLKTVHGQELADPYAWLRQRDDPRVLAYLEAENAYTTATMASTLALQEQLYGEMVGRIEETDCTVPIVRDDYFYYARTAAGLQYPIHARKRGDLKQPEEVLIDLNAMAIGRRYLELGALKVSPDHQKLAYSLDDSGSERFSLRIKDLATDELFPEVIGNTARSLVWANDSRVVFYATLDKNRRPYRVYRHLLGQDPRHDELMFEEPDERFFLSLFKTRSQRFLGIELGSKTTTEVHLLADSVPLGDAPSAPGAFQVLFPRRPGIEYQVDHHGDYFYLLSNEHGHNFHLLRVPCADPDLSRAEEILPHRPAVKLDSLDLFAQHMVIYLRADGLRRIQVFDLESGAEHYIAFPEPVYTLTEESNPNFQTTQFRFGYSSLVTPRTVFDYDLVQRRLELRKQTQVHNYDPSQYHSERILVSAEDGTAIPISLVYRGNLELDGQRPLLLYGYGAYGAAIEPSFSSNRLSLLDRDFIYAIAHVRGGGELGRHWYDEGKLFKKKNTFTDFVAAARFLITQGYTAADRLAIRGGSAGGLLIGAVLNCHPELFRVAIAEVPFVDVLNTMLDPAIPLTVLEYEEWGNPAEREVFDYIRSYSPYDNLAAQGYPHLLITAGLNDPRVQYWEPAKWAAKLRRLKTDVNRLLLKVDLEVGHRGASGRYDALREEAFKLAFVLDVLGS